MKTSGKLTRIDLKFTNDMIDSAKVRVNNGLCGLNPRDTSVRKMTELLTRTNSYKKALEELKFKPEKKK